jgi:DNA-binding beta-propeller fold protein YncE
VTTATPAGGLYGAPKVVTLTANEPATVYYTVDGTMPAVGGPSTLTGPSPLGGIAIGAGGTTLKFFSVDSAGNVESPVHAETYTVDVTVPDITLTGPPPGPLGLLSVPIIGWQSDKAGTYQVELGGTTTPGSGTLLDSGSIAAATPHNNPVRGSQLGFSAATPLHIFVTDALGHLGLATVSLSLKPLVTVPLGIDLEGRPAFLPSGAKLYLPDTGANRVRVLDTDPASGTYNTVLATVATGTRPQDLASTPDGSRVYICENTGMGVLSTATDTATSLAGALNAPNGIAVTPDGTRAYFLTFDSTIDVLDVNPASGTYHTVTTAIPRTLLLSGSIAIAPDGSRAIVNWQGTIAHAVDVLDVNPASLTFNTILGTPVPIVSGIGGNAAVSPDSLTGYATDVFNNACRIDPATSTVTLHGTSLGLGMLTPDGTTLVQGSGGSLQIRRSSDLALVDPAVPLGPGTPGVCAISPDGTRAYGAATAGGGGLDLVVIPLK